MLKTIFLLLLVLIVSGSTTSAQQSRAVATEKEILAELETTAPQSLADFKAASEAMDAQNYDKAVELFLRVYQEAPNFDAALRRLGSILVHTGKTEPGFRFLRQALAIRRSPENLLSLAQALTFPGKDGTLKQKQEAYGLVTEANRLTSSPDADALMLQARLALDLKKIDDFRNTT